MPAVSLLVPGAPGDRATHQKITLASKRYAVTFDYLDPESTFAGLVPSWVEQERPFGKPITQKGPQQLTRLSLKATFAGSDPQQGIETSLLRLSSLGQLGDPVSISYGRMSSNVGMTQTGYWLIKDLQITVVARRQGTNDATRADITIELLENNIPRWSAPSSLASPLPANSLSSASTLLEAGSSVAWLGDSVAGALNGPRSSSTGGQAPVTPTYVVKSGDTLPAIAAKVYGDANAWRILASLNKILDPRFLAVGGRLLMP